MSTSRPEPPGNSIANSSEKLPGDVGERGLEDAHDLFVDRLDDPRELAARVAHVVELLLQELVPLDQRLVLRRARAG